MKGIYVMLKKVDVNGGRHSMMDAVLGCLLIIGESRCNELRLLGLKLTYGKSV
jgi:hypothetical protein